MKDMIDEFAKIELENFIDKNLSIKIMQDEIYLQDMKDAEEIRERFNELGITLEQQRIIDDYTACIISAYTRIRDIAYLTGAKDMMMLLENREESK